MPNVQQPEMRRSGQTRLVQDSDGPQTGTGRSARAEHRHVPADQRSPYGLEATAAQAPQEPAGREAEGE
jgi:hypothetical protein